MVKHILLSGIILAFFSQGQAQESSIIPRPATTEWHNGNFFLNRNTVLIAGEAEMPSVEFFNDYLEKIYGIRLHVQKSDRQQPSSGYIRLTASAGLPAGVPLQGQPDRKALAGTERYHLDVTPDAVRVNAETPEGVFYGIQTLIQLLPVEPFMAPAAGRARPSVRPASAGFGIRSVTIDDQPRFAYRGMHLDVGRHFFPVSFVKKYIDFIALHKMNYFHWHLTEDQGWRIEIKRYPNLTEVGGWRSGTIIGHHPGIGNDSTVHGGFYTQDEIRDVIKYAADRYITIIPEIELPGHASAALASYPWLGCTGGPYQVKQAWGVFKDVYCAGNDSVFQFLENVLDEVIALFPSTYIHIGGDECPKDSWKTCPKCQRRIHQLGLKDENELQSYFVSRVEKYINSKGRQIIGWDEILEGGLAPNATVMSWRGEKGGIEAARQKHEVIMTPGSAVYFDHSQVQVDDSLTIGGYLPLEKVYQYEPVPSELNAEESLLVRGAQANVWTEYMSNPRKVEYMIFPRMTALSEVLWTPKEGRDYSDFQRRLQTQYKRYALWGVNSYRAYMPPTDSLVQKKLTSWQDAKFGLLMHWGTYSQWGIVESWSICPEDEGWTQRSGPYAANYHDYLQAYQNLQKTFKPTHFDPAKWAAAAKDAGMKYVVFTTKHHDGFCMFDTKQTDYKVTSRNCPFGSNPRSNVAGEIFSAFRKEGFMTGAYFSKPDWHSENYWWPYFPPKDRNVNYDPAKHPEKWQAFKDYTYKQIEELMTGYGKMDLLWLDGGWVRPLSSVDPGVDWERDIPYDQDIDMPRIAAMARSHQPGLLIVDRSVPGEFENYRTPEQSVPSHVLDDPWETCMTMAGSWSYVPHDHYKSAGDLIHLLIKIVSRGGNLLLNVGPAPDGTWDDTAYARLKEIGSWMKVNGEGIYGSRPLRPYAFGDSLFITQSKDSSAQYLFYLLKDKDQSLPSELAIGRFTAKKDIRVSILGRSEPLVWRLEGRRLIIVIPSELRNRPAGEYSVTFKIE
jgi:alpha-L-fucosidase